MGEGKAVNDRRRNEVAASTADTVLLVPGRLSSVKRLESGNDSGVGDEVEGRGLRKAGGVSEVSVVA